MKIQCFFTLYIHIIHNIIVIYIIYNINIVYVIYILYVYLIYVIGGRNHAISLNYSLKHAANKTLFL